ncbi:MAG: type 4a pilus biogenesis protein PilO [Armatimonadetes bacterium]|nr:type 4a pilus biogenesis protein PilO [Armatimonadota bacterium]
MNRKTPNPTAFMVLALAALLAGGAIVYWQTGNIGKVRARVASISAQVADTSNLEEELGTSKTRLIQARRQLHHLESNVSTEESIPTLLMNLQATGESCNLQISGVRPLPPPAKKRSSKGDADGAEPRKAYGELDVQVKCIGTYEQVMEFLKKLEDFPKIVGVRHVSIQPKVNPDGMTLESITATLNIRVYVFPKAESLEPGRPDPDEEGAVEEEDEDETTAVGEAA